MKKTLSSLFLLLLLPLFSIQWESLTSEESLVTDIEPPRHHFLLLPSSHTRLSSWMALAFQILINGSDVTMLLPSARQYYSEEIRQFNLSLALNAQTLTASVRFLLHENPVDGISEYVTRNTVGDPYGWVTHLLYPLSVFFQYPSWSPVYDDVISGGSYVTICDPWNWPAIAVALKRNSRVILFNNQISSPLLGSPFEWMSDSPVPLSGLPVPLSTFNSFLNPIVGTIQRMLMFPACFVTHVFYPDDLNFQFYSRLLTLPHVINVHPSVARPSDSSRFSFTTLAQIPERASPRDPGLESWLNAQWKKKRMIIFVRFRDVYAESERGPVSPEQLLDHVGRALVRSCCSEGGK